MAKYRVGLIGAGRKGTQHARAYMLDERTELVAVADGDPENLVLFQKRTGVPGYADYRQMLEKEALDIAAPVLPVGVSPEVVIACAQAGVKAILCEKPIAASLEEADRMVAECKRRRIPFGAGDLDVNLPAYQKALKFIGAGELGGGQAHHIARRVGRGDVGWRLPALYADAPLRWMRRGGLGIGLGQRRSAERTRPRRGWVRALHQWDRSIYLPEQGCAGPRATRWPVREGSSAQTTIL